MSVHHGADQLPVKLLSILLFAIWTPFHYLSCLLRSNAKLDI